MKRRIFQDFMVKVSTVRYKGEMPRANLGKGATIRFRKTRTNLVIFMCRTKSGLARLELQLLYILRYGLPEMFLERVSLS